MTGLPFRIPNSRASTISPSRLPVWRRTLFPVSHTYSAVALCRWHCDRRCLSRASSHLSGTGDHIYADGGLLNNIPIDVAKEMGADIVIGIHLETQPLSPTAPLSSFAVLGQSISVMIAANELRSMEQADLLVTVPLQKYTALDYGAAEAIIKAGYDAAASKAKVLSAFSVSEAEWQQYLADRNARQENNTCSPSLSRLPARVQSWPIRSRRDCP